MRPDPNLPRGVQAFLFEVADSRRRAEASATDALVAAGFREILLPVLDYAAPYEGITANGDERVYRFMDRHGELLSLRADFTPMAARILAPRLAGLPQPVSVFYRGDVVRDEDSGVGRPREFGQVGAERYGDPSFEADETTLELALRCLSGVPAPRLRVTLGYAGLLEKVLVAAAPSLTRGDGAAVAALMRSARERRVTRVETVLIEHGVSPENADEISRALLEGLDRGSRLLQPLTVSRGAAELVRAARLVEAGRDGISVVIDLAGTPDAPYYTGLTFSIHAAGVPSPLASGGRYDDLLSRFGYPSAAVGFSIGVDALAAALETSGRDGLAESPESPLRIAVGKGRLLARTLDSLRAGGADFDEPDGRRLLYADRSGRFELLLLKDDDVPTYVAHGGAHLGVVGADRVAESGEDVFSPVELPFGACRLSLIGRAGEPFEPNGHPVTVGTKYQRLASRYFDERRIAHEIVPLSGSVELAAALRLTDVVVDLIETGSTLAANGLAEIETILPSRATLIVGRSALVTRRSRIASFVEGLRARARDRTAC